jgi:hypothetical protein
MPSNPDRRIQLTLTTQRISTGPSIQSYRLTVVTSNGNLMPNEVFRYVRISAGVGYPTAVDKYQGICTPSELINLPIDNPDPTATLPQFRKSSLDLTFTDITTAEDAVAVITTALRDLKTALDFTDDQTQPVDVWIGTPPV